MNMVFISGWGHYVKIEMHEVYHICDFEAKYWLIYHQSLIHNKATSESNSILPVIKQKQLTVLFIT